MAIVQGCTHPAYTGDPNGAPCNPLELDSVLRSDNIYPDMTVGDILNTENKVLCYTYDDLL